MATVTPPSAETSATDMHSAAQGGSSAKPKPQTLKQLRLLVEKFLLFVIERSATHKLNIDRLIDVRAELGHQLEAAADTVVLTQAEFDQFLPEHIYHGRLYLADTLIRLRCFALMSFGSTQPLPKGEFATLGYLRTNFDQLVRKSGISLAREDFDECVSPFFYKDHEGLIRAIGHLERAKPTK